MCSTVILIITFFEHAQREAFLEPAELASDPVAFVDDAVLVLDASVLELFLDRPLEEGLASFAALHAIVEPRGLVAADSTQPLTANVDCFCEKTFKRL